MFERNIESFKIHDLVRDMAIKIARDVNFTSLDDSGMPELSAESRHLGIFDNGAIENVESTRAKKPKIESKLRTLWGLDMEKEMNLQRRDQKPDLSPLIFSSEDELAAAEIL
ncbi:hypothetical protein MRB53_024515 [Persea americana]|uniref:Uncharacterized protein n=1 Tax=Persea americana TaxID=3435 RepID=A0ACC2LCU7_PERAE|nr:hypothetical protein MRB53_024515 [Persea americana]